MSRREPTLILRGPSVVFITIMWLSVATGAAALVAQVYSPKSVFSLALGPAMLLGPAAAVVVGILHVRGRRIIREHKWLLCPRCHYDLRGCTSDVCPECGRPWTPGEVQQLWREAYQEDRSKRREY